jgi:hypothetical protein
MVGGTTESDLKQDCEFLVMSAKNKDKSKTLQGRLEAQLKAKALRFQPDSIEGRWKRRQGSR